jgi:hypothetical protein
LKGHPETGDNLFMADPEKPALNHSFEHDLTLTLIRIMPLSRHPTGGGKSPSPEIVVDLSKRINATTEAPDHSPEKDLIRSLTRIRSFLDRSD